MLLSLSLLLQPLYRYASVRACARASVSCRVEDHLVIHSWQERTARGPPVACSIDDGGAARRGEITAAVTVVRERHGVN